MLVGFGLLPAGGAGLKKGSGVCVERQKPSLLSSGWKKGPVMALRCSAEGAAVFGSEVCRIGINFILRYQDAVRQCLR